MNDFLDRFAKRHRLPRTFLAAKRWATRSRRADDPPHPNDNGKLAVIPIAESKMILERGKAYWRAWKARQQ